MAGRRGNNEGSLTKRPDGRWEARITLADGKRKSYYGKTRQEAAKRLAAAVRDQNVGLPIVGEKQNLAQYLTYWLEVVRPTIKPRTYRLYEMFVRVHIAPGLGTTALARLSPQHIQAFYAGRLETGLSSTSVRHIHDVLHRALDAALKLGLVQRNVTELIDPPRMRHHEMTVLTPEQVRAFLAAAKRDRYYALYVLALTTGMRQGELLALKWRDVDLESAKLNVRATLQPVKGQGFVLSAPKTKRSRRTIALTSTAVEALRDHQRQQEIEREKLGAAWAHHDLVFPNTVGRPFDGIHLLQRNFRPLLERAGLPRIRFHDLRHTTATLLLGRGINPKIVSEMLGHAQVAITLDIYSHVMPHMQEQAVAAMDALLEYE
jgi:integrase